MSARRSLSPVLHRPPWRIAAIEETRIAAHPLGDGAVFAAEKRPLALLVTGPGGVAGTDPAGRALSLEDIETMLPGALDRLDGAGTADGAGSKPKEEDR